MIKNILDLLKLLDHYGISENIEIAKGKNEIPNNYKKIKKQFKRWHKDKKI